MGSFKRNQVEEAVIATLQGDQGEPDLRVRIKRLLDADRVLGRDKRRPEGRYAFYSDDAPGTGIEVWFSSYEAFAILVALRILAHGWPQGTVVRIMRRVRKDLEAEHRRMLVQDAAELFNEAEMRAQAKPGMIVTGSTDPVFLAITSADSLAQRHTKATQRHTKDRLKGFAVCRGRNQLMNFILKVMPVGLATTSLELTDAAHRLSSKLSETQPSRRGRAG